MTSERIHGALEAWHRMEAAMRPNANGQWPDREIMLQWVGDEIKRCNAKLAELLRSGKSPVAADERLSKESTIKLEEADKRIRETSEGVGGFDSDCRCGCHQATRWCTGCYERHEAGDGMGGGSKTPDDAAASVGGMEQYAPQAYAGPGRAAANPARHPSDPTSQDEQEIHLLEFNRDFIGLAAIARRLLKEIAVDDQLLADRNRLLALFECSIHGAGCVPHAIDEVKCLRLERDEARRQLAEHRCKLPDSIEWALNSGDGVYRP